jgi:hypothetical protein
MPEPWGGTRTGPITEPDVTVDAFCTSGDSRALCSLQILTLRRLLLWLSWLRWPTMPAAIRGEGLSMNERRASRVRSRPDRTGEYLRLQYEQLLEEIRATKASVAEREKLAALLRQAINEEDYEEVADRITSETPFKGLGNKFRDVSRRHPPSWGAWLSGLLIPPLMQFGSFFGAVAPTLPPPEPVTVAQPLYAPDNPSDLPDPKVLREILGQLSPKEVHRLSPQALAIRTQRVSTEIMEQLARKLPGIRRRAK